MGHFLSELAGDTRNTPVILEIVSGWIEEDGPYVLELISNPAMKNELKKIFSKEGGINDYSAAVFILLPYLGPAFIDSFLSHKARDNALEILYAIYNEKDDNLPIISGYLSRWIDDYVNSSGSDDFSIMPSYETDGIKASKVYNDL